ncbi:hypothetical protein C8Q76DRAFT_123826 [Earliella scabrosa]|nr:hypothetical protein C8Q76DRAFT_123826 [Earliella scabrosa]
MLTRLLIIASLSALIYRHGILDAWLVGHAPNPFLRQTLRHSKHREALEACQHVEGCGSFPSSTAPSWLIAWLIGDRPHARLGRGSTTGVSMTSALQETASGTFQLTCASGQYAVPRARGLGHIVW